MRESGSSENRSFGIIEAGKNAHEDGIGDLVTDLVRVTLTDRLAKECAKI